MPGENYNENIEHEVDKSDLFVLSVTNNLLEPNNYVMRIEYPMAVSKRKNILSIAFETIKDENFYISNSINEYVDFFNEEQIMSKLERVREKLNISVLKDSPEHLYYIGLAYLLGFKVKKDIERSIQLIEKAANGGYIEAFCKLGGI